MIPMEQTTRTPSATERRILCGLQSLIDPAKAPAASREAVAAVADCCKGWPRWLPGWSLREAYGDLCDDLCRQLFTNDVALDPLRALCRPDAPRMDERMHRWLQDATAAAKIARDYVQSIRPPYDKEFADLGINEAEDWVDRTYILQDLYDLLNGCLIRCENQLFETSTVEVADNTQREARRQAKSGAKAAGVRELFTEEQQGKIRAVSEDIRLAAPGGKAQAARLYRMVAEVYKPNGLKVAAFVRWLWPDADLRAVRSIQNAVVSQGYPGSHYAASSEKDSRLKQSLG